MSTTVQDHPGRARMWAVGVPPSGAMDPLALQYANALVNNGASAAGLEVTLRGPKLKFHRRAWAAVCGGEFPVALAEGGHRGARRAVPMWAAFEVPAGAVLEVGTAAAGQRCYIAVDGGFDAPVYLGSRATFPSGGLGGYQGRPLQVRAARREARSNFALRVSTRGARCRCMRLARSKSALRVSTRGHGGTCSHCRCLVCAVAGGRQL